MCSFPPENLICLVAAASHAVTCEPTQVCETSKGDHFQDRTQSFHGAFAARFSAGLAFCSLRTRWDLGVQNRTEGSNPSRSPSDSLDCREISLRSPEIREIWPYFAIFLDKADWRERTTQYECGYGPSFSLNGTCAVRFQEGHEAKAMRSRAGDAAMAS
jgi:hypothetical protein